MNREQLEAELAVLDQTEALEALKQKIRDGDQSEETLAAFKAAKTALFETRSASRKNRVAPAPEDGAAAPETLAVTTGVTEVG